MRIILLFLLLEIDVLMKSLLLKFKDGLIISIVKELMGKIMLMKQLKEYYYIYQDYLHTLLNVTGLLKTHVPQ